MEPKGDQKLVRYPTFRVPKSSPNKGAYFDRFWVPLDAFGRHFLCFLALVGSLLAGFGGFWASNREAKPSKTTPTPGETKNCQGLAEIPPRAAEIPPRTAENPPRTRPEPAVRTSSKKNIPRYGFYESTSFSDRRSNKTPRTKVGRRCSPLGGLQLNNK